VFGSPQSLRKVVADRSLDDALEEFGVTGCSGLFRIEVGDGGLELNLPGWVSVRGDGDLRLSLMRGIQ
jgi:hypothetical protein